MSNGYCAFCGASLENTREGLALCEGGGCKTSVNELCRETGAEAARCAEEWELFRRRFPTMPHRKAVEQWSQAQRQGQTFGSDGPYDTRGYKDRSWKMVARKPVESPSLCMMQLGLAHIKAAIVSLLSCGALPPGLDRRTALGLARNGWFDLDDPQSARYVWYDVCPIGAMVLEMELEEEEFRREVARQVKVFEEALWARRRVALGARLSVPPVAQATKREHTKEEDPSCSGECMEEPMADVSGMFCAYCGGTLEHAEKPGPVCSGRCAADLRAMLEEVASTIESGRMLRRRAVPHIHDLRSLAWQEVASPVRDAAYSILSLGEERAKDAIAFMLVKNLRASIPKGQLSLCWKTEFAPAVAKSSEPVADVAADLWAWHSQESQGK